VDPYDVENPYHSPPPPPADRGGPYCVNCGYDLGGLTVGQPCPECGTAVARSLRMGDGGGSNGFAIAALVLGIVSFVAGCFGVITAPIAIYCANRFESDVASGVGDSSSLGLAKAGRICGYIYLALAGLLIVLWILMLIVSVAVP